MTGAIRGVVEKTIFDALHDHHGQWILSEPVTPLKPSGSSPHCDKAAAIAADAIPDGWAKLDGEWVELVCLGKDIGEHQLQEIDGPLWALK